MNSKVVIESRKEAEAVRQAAAAKVKTILAYADLNAERRDLLTQAVNELYASVKVALVSATDKAGENSIAQLKDLAREFGADALWGAIDRVGDTEVAVSINLRDVATTAVEAVKIEAKMQVIAAEIASLPADAVAKLLGGTAPTEDGAAEYAIVLTGIGPNKINVIKAVREVTNFGLKEAKDLCDLVSYSNQTVTSGLTRSEAVRIEQKFAEAGASAEIARVAVAAK